MCEPRFLAEVQRLAELLAPLIADAAVAMVRDVQFFCFSNPYTMPEVPDDEATATLDNNPDASGGASSHRQGLGIA